MAHRLLLLWSMRLRSILPLLLVGLVSPAAGKPAVDAPAARQAPAKPVHNSGSRNKYVDTGVARAELLRNPNFFGELKPTDPAEIPPGQAWKGREATIQRLVASDARLFSGELGRLHAARFVDRPRRTDGDFRYAYGEKAFHAFMRADKKLRDIPVGQLADRLDLNLLSEVNREAFVPGDQPLRSRIETVWRKLRPWINTKPGEIRKINNDFMIRGAKDEEIAELKAKGMRFRELPGSKPNARLGQVKFIDHKQVKPGLEALVQETKKALKDPNSDGIQIAAHFVERYIALHPFGDGNGRTARLFMDRILMEKGMVPPILEKLGEDVTLSEQAYAQRIGAGVLRMAGQLGNDLSRSTTSWVKDASGKSVEKVTGWAAPQAWETKAGETVSGRGSAAMGYHSSLFAAHRRAGAEEWRPIEARKPVFIDSLPFSQGQDGFLYDMTGRPHTVDEKGRVRPMAQMNYYLMVRRAAERTDGGELLGRYTASTRQAYDKLKADPKFASQLKLESDRQVIKADNRYQLKLARRGNADFVALFDPSKAEPKELLAHSGGGDSFTPSGHAGTAAMSRYTQIDLEMWHAEQGLKRAGDRQGAKQLHAYRVELFDISKKYLAGLAPKDGVTPDNPLGFTKEFERVQYDHSPLKYGSLKEYLKKHGDKTIWIWRGDQAYVPWTGIHPDNVPFRPDAKDLARLRGKYRGTHNLFGDLDGVEGHVEGTGYQSFTSDLALLARQFADGSSTRAVNLPALPRFVRNLLAKRLPEGEKVRLRSLREVLGVVAGVRKVTPPEKGQVNVAGIDARAVDEALAEAFSGADLETAKQRVDEARQAAAPRGLLGRLSVKLFGDRPAWVKVDDLKGSRAYGEDLGSSLDKLGTLFEVEHNMVDDKDSLSVTSHRRAFGIEVDRKSALPGIRAAGGYGFEDEQEIHVLTSVMPWRVKGSWSKTALERDLPKAAQPTKP